MRGGRVSRKMANKYDSELIPLAKELRRNMTAEERLLWYTFLRKHEPRFYRQRVVGRYILDFYCSAARLAVELDGSQHYEVDGMQKDHIRTEELEELGLLVIRIPNNEVRHNLRGVCEYIDLIVAERNPSVAPRQLP